MRAQFARPYATRDFDQLARNAAALAALNPNPVGWSEWTSFARAAEQAARAHDDEALLQSCTRCHRAYRKEYVEQYRERAFASSHDAM
ncbi:MAG: hypothetical protein ABJB12_22575 [Pseudomonadota bacterium]